METHAEIARLRAVYHDYAASGFGASKWSPTNLGNQAIQAERGIKTRQLLQRAGFLPPSKKRILDVGCGGGEQLGLFLEWGASPENLFGIDLLPERISAARRALPHIAFETANGECLPYDDGAFDLVVAFTVFTSILDRRMALNVSREMARVLAPQGAVLWYDFRMNNPLNRHVRGISRRQAQSLFHGFEANWVAVSLLPPLARRLGRFTATLYGPLSSLSFLRTHLLGLLTKL